MAKQLGLFGEVEPEPAPRRGVDPAALPVPEKLGPPRLRFGTSSWTYPGWQGKVYRDVGAYGSRFSQLSLGEYARDPRFRTASADNLYYVAPRERMPMLQRFRELVEDVPGFDLCPKAWHGVTVSRYSKLQVEQWRLTSEINRHFLDAEAFLGEVVWPLKEGLGPCLGPLILEVQQNDLSPDAFAHALDRLLGAAMKRAAFRIGVELRTLGHFTERYLDVLAAHGAAHVMNSWTRMPPIGWQLDHIRGHLRGRPARLWMARALLRPGELRRGELIPGSSYDEAVEAYQPYDRVQRPLEAVREDILRVIAQAGDDAAVYVLINNRLEGHAPGTIAALQARLSAGTAGFPSGGAHATGEGS
jgi:uncharacterized protein YecE (DUF72 family)